MTNTKIITRDRFYAIVNSGKRTPATVDAASRFVRDTLSGGRLARAVYLHVRVTTDGLSVADAAAEAGVTGARVTQIRAGLSAALNAGLTLPIDAATADVLADLYAHLSTVYKSGPGARERLSDAVKRASALSDIDAKYATLSAVEADERKRTARPGGNKGKGADDTGADDTGAGNRDAVDVVTDARTPLQRAVDAVRNAADTVERLSSTDAATVLAMVDDLSDALAARMSVTDAPAPAATARKRKSSANK